MVKSQPEKTLVVSCVSPGNGAKKSSSDVFEEPPQIPPRMKKKGPALPEKPPHMKAKTSPIPSSQTLREPLKPRVLSSSNIEKYHSPQREVLNIEKYHSPQREVLVAASKGARDRPVEKRQREPAKLLMPTSGESSRKELTIMAPVLDDRLGFTTKRDVFRVDPGKSGVRKSRPPQPVLLIPRGMLPWGLSHATPVSYALWMQRDGPPVKGPSRREVVKQPPQLEYPDTTLTRGRSGSVTRSGSLTSQGSSSSDSGNETFPKSVLKKHKRTTPSSASKATGNSNRKLEHKKNVTFNAFATVQLMEE